MIAKRIWFWQERRYGNQGWCITRTCFIGTSIDVWPEAIVDLICPVATK